VKSAFRELVGAMPATGRIVAAVGHDGVRDVLAYAPCAVSGYAVERVGRTASDRSDTSDSQTGPPEAANWWAHALRPEAGGLRFQLEDRAGGRSFEVLSPLFGAHNVENVVAVMAALDSLGVPLDEAIEALRGHRGVKRRQEVRGVAAGVTVIDDFAHHPTAVAGTIEAIAQKHAGRRVVALLEPRTNTSRRALFQDDYVDALERADRVAIAEVGDEPLYSMTGDVTECLSASAVAGALRDRGCEAEAFEEIDQIVDWVVEGRQEGDVVLVMSNGAFGGIWEKLLKALGNVA
jgi:UDP-N-acetylmuramate: L-alanyl-gamma-D-glutamyl-meso-diaminopimelate ligase